MRVVVLTCTSWEVPTGLYMSFASRDPEREIACGTLEINERVAGLSRVPGERLHIFYGTTLDCSRVVKKGLKERMDHR